MDKFYKNDLLDAFYERYKESFDLTVDPKEDVEVTKIHTANLGKEYKRSQKRCVLKPVKKCEKFEKKEWKHKYKLELLDFEYLTEEEIENLSFFGKLNYYRRERKFEREIKRFKKLVIKYKRYLPENYVNPDDDIYEEAEELYAEKVLIKDKPENERKSEEAGSKEEMQE